MTNFSNFAVQEKDFGAYAFATLGAALKSFWHVINGIYIWEYIATLDFELDTIRGRRPYRWTIWIYSLARASLLIAIILILVGFNVTTPLNCQALITLEFGVAYVSLVSASFLIIIRIIAIWNKSKFAVAIAAISWLTNVSFIIHGVSRLRATWSPVLQNCDLVNTAEIKPTLIITLITDIVLLVTMLVGLFRLRTGSNAFGLGRLLWKQGIIWFLLATIAGIPPTVLTFLNLNAPLNLMFQLPAVITNTIAATRIYRALADYSFAGSTDGSLGASLSKSDIKVSKMKWNSPTPISLNRIEVAVESSYEQYPTSQTRFSMGSAQQGDKPHELSVGSDQESAIATGIAK